MQGNSLSEDFLYLEFNVLKCTGVGCPTDMNSVMSKLRIEIPFTNTYFDFEDYEDPVHTYIDGRLTIDVLPGYRKSNDLFIQ